MKLLATNAYLSSLKVSRLFISLSGLVCFLLVWQAVTYAGIWDSFLLPSPYQTLRAISLLAGDGTLLHYTGISLLRFATGYLVAVAIAVPVGLLLGWSAALHRVANPVLQMLRPVSPTAWFPFIVLWFGIGDAPAIVIIGIATFFPVLFSTISATASLPPIYRKVADNFGLTRSQFLLKVALPAVKPQIFTGLRIAIGTAWIFLVAGEMVGAQAGLGYLIVDARNNLSTDLVLAAILIIGVTGWALDVLVSKLAKVRL